jgi:hypothetical protein
LDLRESRKTLPEKSILCPVQINSSLRVWKQCANASSECAASANRRFEFDKGSQLFI